MNPRVLTLAIETSNPSAWEAGIPFRPGVAIAEGSMPADFRVLGVEEIDPGQRHDDDLLPAIDRLARRVGISARQLTRIAVSAGPGGFTAVRMAITIAKTIADVTGAVCIPVPSMLVVASNAVRGHAAADSPLSRPFAIALASKSDSTYLGTFNPDGSPRDVGRIITADDVQELGIGVLLADRFLPDQIRRAAGEKGITIEPIMLDPATCARVSLALPAVDPAMALPIYPRVPEAVRKWRELHGTKPATPDGA